MVSLDHYAAQLTNACLKSTEVSVCLLNSVDGKYKDLISICRMSKLTASKRRESSNKMMTLLQSMLLRVANFNM